jgi:hypothetical protein
MASSTPHWPFDPPRSPQTGNRPGNGPRWRAWLGARATPEAAEVALGVESALPWVVLVEPQPDDAAPPRP